ncbi:MAG: Asp-tRNA(Asn)/Glu-tRNA(Gln) amidotransferase subunit GatB, partial [Rickettsiales bacterium]
MSSIKNNLIKGNTGDWEIIIGLEVHAQINTNSKLFSGASTEFGQEPNMNVAFVDAGMPGMLPVLNEKAVEQAIKTGLAINAQINLKSVFDRKNYFYPDLPQGYQISQFLDPIVGKGEMLLDMPDGVKKVGVTRIHIEQDAGKSLHEYKPKNTCIDLNRAGVPLMEIVSEPDMRSADEAVAYMKKLRSIVRYIDACDGDMEKGNMRCDANVSVRKIGDPLGTRCEIKNLNSMRFMNKAIEFEAMRQVEILESGGEIRQETRLFDSAKGETRTMRTKEDAHDYRYFPDPDLLPLEFTQSYVDSIKATLPELPDAKKQRYMQDYKLSAYDAGVIVAEQEYSSFYETLAKENDPQLAANWMTGELFGRLNKMGIELADSPITAQKLSGLLKLISDNTISGKIAKDVLDLMFETGKD